MEEERRREASAQKIIHIKGKRFDVLEQRRRKHDEDDDVELFFIFFEFVHSVYEI